ncbi:MAG: hypothetical protein ABFS38_01800 [Bacteroidota bacterium]
MRFSLQPEQRPEQKMRTISIDEVLSLGEKLPGERPQLEHYFSPTKREAFIKDYLHYLNSGLLDAKHGNLDMDLYLVFVLSFQFTAPLLEIPAEKELGLFYRLLQKTYQVEEIDMNLNFSIEAHKNGMVSEQEAINTYRDELEDTYNGIREVTESVQKRLKKDAIEAIMKWQREKNIPALAEAFGRSIVIPSFFSFMDKRMLSFYRGTTRGISYRVAVPEVLE